MNGMVSSFHQECLDNLAFLEYLVSDECMLSDSEKLRTVELYEQYLEEMLEWYAHCTNEMLLPVTDEKYLESFWKETQTYMRAIPLSQNTWIRDKETLEDGGNECYENMQSIQTELAGIVGDSTMALRQEQAASRKELTDAGYTEARAEKIVSYMSRDWETELQESYLRQGYPEEEAAAMAKEEAAQREWELDVMLSLSGKLTDDASVLWEKLTYLLDLELYEEAEECIILYQSRMTNSDRYMPALVLYLQLKQEGLLDHGIMVMEYYKDDGINGDLMIGDIIYQFNGAPCRTVDDYIAAKNALTSDTYTVKLVRLDENYQTQVLALTIPTDSPRVYLHNLLPET